MIKALLLSTLLISCASLTRDDSKPIRPDAPTETVPVDAGVSSLPDSSVPDAQGGGDDDDGTCHPECHCDSDCPENNSCVYGICHQRCDCDFDCGNHYECRSHVCYNPHY